MKKGYEVRIFIGEDEELAFKSFDSLNAARSAIPVIGYFSKFDKYIITETEFSDDDPYLYELVN